ncbi:hypothetical protein ABTY96_44940 [Streptomyces sp. NPDC096057]|uniref:hypothetical protein n=1 Tax=Streptomyces sp. NPDC096057 TaxID=3155543 RepID=UPI003331DA2E
MASPHVSDIRCFLGRYYECGAFFLRWIKAEKSLARTTRHGYQEHLDNYLVPHLEHINRRDLKVRHLDLMYNAIERENAERILHGLRVTELQEARDEVHRAWVKTAGYAKREERRPFIFLGPRRGGMAALPWTEVSTDALAADLPADRGGRPQAVRRSPEGRKRPHRKR